LASLAIWILGGTYKLILYRTLTGLAIRIAHSLGLHRDGTNFDVSPFDTEMRRRCWWQICVLDVRTISMITDAEADED
jgi:hypothetical protein